MTTDAVNVDPFARSAAADVAWFSVLNMDVQGFASVWLRLPVPVADHAKFAGFVRKFDKQKRITCDNGGRSKK